MKYIALTGLIHCFEDYFSTNIKCLRHNIDQLISKADKRRFSISYVYQHFCVRI